MKTSLQGISSRIENGELILEDENYNIRVYIKANDDVVVSSIGASSKSILTTAERIDEMIREAKRQKKLLDKMSAPTTNQTPSPIPRLDIEKEWDTIEKKLIPLHAPPIQRSEMKKAFYCGCFVIFHGLLKRSDYSDEELRELCNDFCEQMSKFFKNHTPQENVCKSDKK